MNIDQQPRNTAFIYDNAVALLTFLADGSADSLRRAKLIGDAIVYGTSDFGNDLNTFPFDHELLDRGRIVARGPDIGSVVSSGSQKVTLL